MYSKFIKAIVWIQEKDQKVPYVSKVYGEYSVRKDETIKYEDKWVITHNASGLSVRRKRLKKDAELLCMELEDTMTCTWDGKGGSYDVPDDFRDELRDILQQHNGY